MFSRIASKVNVPLAAAGISGMIFAKKTAYCSGEDHIPSLDFGWSHHGAMAAYDAASIRRGFQVYRQVCASCHSVNRVAFRSLIGVSHDENEIKKIAESYEVTDGPNDIGEMFERPGN